MQTNNENDENLLPSIPKSLFQEYSRFSSAVWYEEVQKCNVILAGLGGIGSYVAFLLSRLNINRLLLFDGDSVESINLSGQLYNTDDIGKYKSDAICNMIMNYSSFHKFISWGSQMYTSDIFHTEDIMICGFDNMKARKLFYKRWKEHSGKSEDKLFIDGRLAAEEFQVFCIQGNDNRAMKIYELEWLFSDDEADTTTCSYKQTTFMSNMIGSIIVNLFVNFCANKGNPLFYRDVPFFTSYRADTMMFNVKI